VTIAGVITGAACGTPPVATTTTSGAGSSQLTNLHAFARLYGVVRWFHPSDAAAVIDWDRFAIEGARSVIDLPDTRGLRARLTKLFAPIAPTVHLVAAGEAFPDEPALHPSSGLALDVVAWEHEGYGDSSVISAYASKRRHRERTVPIVGNPFGALWQAIDATPYRNIRLRMRGKVRTSSTTRGQLWVRVERGSATGFSDDMKDRPVVSRTWESAEIIGTVDSDATRIVFGTIVSGSGAAWYDDLELAVQGADGAWTPIEIKDPGFEATEPLESWGPGLAKPSVTSIDGWNVTVDQDGAASGKASLRVETATRLLSDELFADSPRPGETVDIDLGGGLRARIPISLYSKDGRTIGDDPQAARQSQTGLPTASPPGFDVAAGVADVIVAWNVLEHFWPYWDTVSVNWTAELDAALRDALDDHVIDDHVATLQRLSVAAPDGHARVTCPGIARRAKPPFAVGVIEGQIVVTSTADPAILRGDVVVSVDGRPATAQLADDESLASGSPQLRRAKACAQFGAGPIGSTVTLRVRRSGAEQSVAVARGDQTLEEFSHPAIERLGDGVYYIDLSRVSMADLDAAMDLLAVAPGVVFDVRRRPNSTHPVLSHLLTRQDSKTWLAVPHVIRPDHGPSSMTGWDTSGWEMPVLQPHIAGRVAFLTGPTATSYAESVMGLVEHYHLGEIVGAPTAGANGNIAQIAEPTGCSTIFTGLRVTKSDGSRFHLIGIRPTIPASRTIAGVTAGRDEVLEKALAYLRRASR
jgi:hypothetical protein